MCDNCQYLEEKNRELEESIATLLAETERLDELDIIIDKLWQANYDLSIANYTLSNIHSLSTDHVLGERKARLALIRDACQKFFKSSEDLDKQG